MTRLPSPSEADSIATANVQAGMAVLLPIINRESEAGIAARRRRAAEWRAHAEGCERRGADYFGLASKLPKAHRDHAYYTSRAEEQMALAGKARMQLEIEEDGL